MSWGRSVATLTAKKDYPLNGYLGCRQTEETVVYVGIRANCISNLSPTRTTDNLNICEGVTTLHFENIMLIKAGDSHRCSVVTIYICKIIVVTGNAIHVRVCFV